MMSLKDISGMSAQATKVAAKGKRKPYLVWPEDIERGLKPGAIPFLGDYVPKGWKRVTLTEVDTKHHGVDTEMNAYFVDTSGVGHQDEPALTIRAFMARLKSGYGYAVVQAGEFQAYVGVYEKV